MKIELGWLYIYIGKLGIHIELEKYPYLWFIFSIANKEAFKEPI